MAIVKTASVRTEISKVAHEIVRLSDAGQASDESRMLLNTLLMIVNMLMAPYLGLDAKGADQR